MESNPILATALKQYNKLSVEIKKVVEVIKLLGGTIPDGTIILEGVPNADEFPKNGTWKERILFILKQYNDPITVTEIASKLAQYDPTLITPNNSLKDLATTVGQYCYMMKDDDIKQIKVTGEKNKYLIKPKI